MIATKTFFLIVLLVLLATSAKDSAGNYEDQPGVYGFGAKIRNGRGSEVLCSQEHDSSQYTF